MTQRNMDCMILWECINNYLFNNYKKTLQEMWIIILILILLCIGYHWKMVTTNNAEHFVSSETYHVEDKGHNVKEVTFPEIRGKREMLLFDYLFFLFDKETLSCDQLQKWFLQPEPRPEEIWDVQKSKQRYRIVNPIDSFDWVLVKSILSKLCQQKIVEYPFWEKIKPALYFELQRREFIFSEKRQQTNNLNNSWLNKRGDFHPLFNETDINWVNVYNQDLQNVNDSLLDINFGDESVFTKKDTIKSYVDTDVKPMGWLYDKDINIQYEQDTDTFDLQHLPLNAYKNRPWTNRAEINFNPMSAPVPTFGNQH